MSVTIKDIAKFAGVSHATVSRVLNNKGSVNEQTRDRIISILQEHGYTPNISARSLISGRSFNLGLYILYDIFLPTFPPDFLPGILAGMSERLDSTPYNVTLFFHQHGKENGKSNAADRISPINLDGIFVLTLEKNVETIRRFIDQGLPVVLVNQHIDGLPVSSVVADDESGAFAVTRHLVSLGHRQIAFVEGNPRYWTSGQRKDGFYKALRAAGLTPDPSLEVIGYYDEELAYKAMKDLLLRQRFTAVFSANDIMALGVYRAIKERGLRIPDDIAVVGFDDTEFARVIDPPLTTVKKPWREIGHEAAGAMLAQIESRDKEYSTKRIALQTRLVIRPSTVVSEGKTKNGH